MRTALRTLRPVRLTPRSARCYHIHHEALSDVLPNNVDSSSESYVANVESMNALIAELDGLSDKIRRGGSEKARQRHVSKGKMLPRDRVQRLLDPHSPFLELSPFAAHECYPGEDIPGANIITGIGNVSGTQCMIVANDATSKGGSYYPLTVKKHLRAQEIARENKLPCVYLVESGGAALPYQAQVFPDEQHFGRIFRNMARLSSHGIPQIAVVHGISVAGGAYMPAMADENIIVRNQGTIFLAGPPLVKAATGEVVDDESLGGGLLHSSESGVTDHLAVDDEHAIVLARKAVSHIGRAARAHLQLPNAEAKAPLYDPLELRGIAPANLRLPLDPRDVIARIVDGSQFHEFKKQYGKTIVTGFARIHGYDVGIIANAGILFSASSQKATHFIQLCEQRGTPLVFLVNVTGYMVGSAAEKGGIARDGAKMVRAVACTTVPKMTVVIGGSFGAGNYGMCGRSYAPRFMFTWPNSKVGVMGADQLSTVMSTIGERDASKKEALRAQIENEAQALWTSARIMDDGIIAPEKTRDALGLGLAVSAGKYDEFAAGRGQFGVFRF